MILVQRGLRLVLLLCGLAGSYIYEQKMAAMEDIPMSVLQNRTVAERINVWIVALLSVYCKRCHTDIAVFTDRHLLQGWDTSVLLIFNKCPLKYKQVL